MKDTTLRSFILVAESVAFTVIVPGTVTVVFPLMILPGVGAWKPASWSALHYVSIFPAVIGVIIYFWCVRDFVVSGRGIPVPLDHPKHLVVRGLYRYVRNPMYLGVLCVLMGEVIFTQSRALLIYTTVWLGFINAVVLLYEEPSLRKKFGAEYERYSRSVRRWLPGFPRNAGG